MSKEQKITQGVYSTSRKISKEVAVHLEMEVEPDAIDLIAELAWKKLQLYAIDLEAFEKHAKRSTITADDVKLLVRRNEILKELLDAKLQTIASNKATDTGVKRKRKVASVS